MVILRFAVEPEDWDNISNVVADSVELNALGCALISSIELSDKKERRISFH